MKILRVAIFINKLPHIFYYDVIEITLMVAFQKKELNK